jgi:Zn-dependent M28 family amino/carboxypeptidase
LIAALALLLISPRSDEDPGYNLASRELVQARLAEYGGDNSRREATLRKIFGEAGCDGRHLSEQPVPAWEQPNILCILPGKSDKIVVVGAHFDRVSGSDGVVDNWSGASLLPSLYQALKVKPRKHTYIFIGFTEEEHGRVGSDFYVQQMTREEVASIDAMVNLDSLGLAAARVLAGHSNKLLTDAFISIGKQMGVPVMVERIEHVGTDGDVFCNRKIPCITIHSLTQEFWNAHILHTPKDRISAVRFDDYYQTYCLLAAYLASLDELANVRQ